MEDNKMRKLLSKLGLTRTSEAVKASKSNVDAIKEAGKANKSAAADLASALAGDNNLTAALSKLSQQVK